MNIYYDIRQITETPLTDNSYYLYVFENYPQKNIKIGKSRNPKQRMASLSGSNNGGNVISRVIIFPPTYIPFLERMIQNHFHRFRLGRTEYFSGITFEEALNFVTGVYDSNDYQTTNQRYKNKNK